MNNKKQLSLFLAALLLASQFNTAYACTRVVYDGPENTILTARSMDWKEDIMPNMWVFPKGMKREGAVAKNPVKWTSKYGSVVVSAFDIASTDGINEKGLVANLLWLAESEYPQWKGKKQGLSIAAWVQYMLDNFATVDEAVNYMKKNRFDVVSSKMPDGSRMATLHLSISDATGDSAIFEFIGGKLQIHHSKDYTVMTNSPVFSSQLALDDYWKTIGGLTFLPGTNRAADRFARASFYIDVIPKSAEPREAAAAVLSVIRNVSVPLGISTPNEPNISSTRWRTVSDQKNKVYFYESTLYPNLIWVNMSNLDFQEGAPVKMLPLAKGNPYSGEVSNSFIEAKPFDFYVIN